MRAKMSHQADKKRYFSKFLVLNNPLATIRWYNIKFCQRMVANGYKY